MQEKNMTFCASIQENVWCLHAQKLAVAFANPRNIDRMHTKRLRMRTWQTIMDHLSQTMKERLGVNEECHGQRKRIAARPVHEEEMGNVRIGSSPRPGSKLAWEGILGRDAALVRGKPPSPLSTVTAEKNSCSENLQKSYLPNSEL